jgi:hypothetical protein
MLLFLILNPRHRSCADSRYWLTTPARVRLLVLCDAKSRSSAVEWARERALMDYVEHRLDQILVAQHVQIARVADRASIRSERLSQLASLHAPAALEHLCGAAFSLEPTH